MLASTSGRSARQVSGAGHLAPDLAHPARWRRQARQLRSPPSPGRRARRNPPPAAVAAHPGPAPSSPASPAFAADSRGVDDFAADPRPVMLYDGVCGLCNAGVDAALRLDSTRALRFAALQSPAGRRLLERSGRRPDDISSVVLVKADGSAYIESAAIVEIGRVLGVLPGPLAALALALPRRGRDALYRTVADNRYSIFGRTEACRLTQGGGGVEDVGRFIVE